MSTDSSEILLSFLQFAKTPTLRGHYQAVFENPCRNSCTVWRCKLAVGISSKSCGFSRLRFQQTPSRKSNWTCVAPGMQVPSSPSGWCRNSTRIAPEPVAVARQRLVRPIGKVGSLSVQYSETATPLDVLPNRRSSDSSSNSVVMLTLFWESDASHRPCRHCRTCHCKAGWC